MNEPYKNTKVVLVGITGGIAAYKAADLTSSLVKSGHEVHVILTKAALDFITPLTLQTLSKNPVWVDEPHLNQGRYVPHIELAEKADLIVIAPATANTIAKIAWGIADNLLTATVLASRAPVLLAPAMNVNMYENPVTQANLKRLKEFGYYFVEPEEGRLACGAVGKGRLAGIPVILKSIEALLYPKLDYKGKTVLVTAGGTREAIDPVRYLGNRSSGKMGFALAGEAQKRGAKVILISGNTALTPPAGVEFYQVESAREMRELVLRHYANVDVVLKAAAVADYTPVTTHEHKIKKESGSLFLELQKTPDILQELGQLKQKQLLVGFAAETQDLLANAREKLAKKRLDLIVANDVTKPGAGFNHDTNLVTLLYPDGNKVALPLLSKQEVAARILDAVASLPGFGRNKL